MTPLIRLVLRRSRSQRMVKQDRKSVDQYSGTTSHSSPAIVIAAHSARKKRSWQHVSHRARDTPARQSESLPTIPTRCERALTGRHLKPGVSRLLAAISQASGCHTGIAVRYFNTEGPVDPAEHYCIDPLERVDLEEILALIARKKYFVLHAPRQTGKTSTLLALQDRLNAERQYRCLYVNVEAGQVAREDTARAMQVLLGQLASRSRDILQDYFVDQSMSALAAEFGPDGCLAECLTRWAELDSRPLVLLIDEIDTLVGDTLISVLRQLRARYDMRPGGFPQNVVLCGVWDVRDYKIYSSREGTHVKGSSAFNINAESLRLGDFSEREVRQLLAQHTAESGQAFEDRAVERVWTLTCGQPWLVNALAYEACFRAENGRERSRPIRVDSIDEARETLILRQATHLDQLAHTLTEERVRRAILPTLAGSSEYSWAVRDLEYLRDLGLVARDYPVRMANPIYAEVIPRELTLPLEATMAGSVDPAWYVKADGSLDMDGLLGAFQDYFREHAESWVERYGHAEAGPQLVLHAYLQRVVNSGDRIGREYAVGRGRSDLLVEWRQVKPHGQACIRKYAVECKVRTVKADLDRLVREGLEQTAAYIDRVGAESGHLVIFDLRPGLSWSSGYIASIRRWAGILSRFGGSSPTLGVAIVRTGDGPMSGGFKRANHCERGAGGWRAARERSGRS